MVRVRLICVGLLTIAILAGISRRAVADRAPGVTIEAGQTGEPISKYIYGQFIEHQGRCIYGGIWAEMIEDRKFYHPIGVDYPMGVISQGGMDGLATGEARSPWKPTGLRQSVVMARENSYVGEHTPQVKLAGQTPHGITQANLALRKGKKYDGRVVLSADGSAKVQVSLIWGPGDDDKQTITIKNLTNEYIKKPLHFTAGGDTDNGRIEIVGRGEGSFSIGAVCLMPGDNIHGMRADTIKLLKELNGTVYRWPGGNFVSAYDWRDGIGDIDKRPPRIIITYWSGAIENNDFGIDEFVTLCRVIDTEPYIAVNSGFGDDRSAAEEVEYANGSVDTPMGKLRAANGHSEPYNIKWWGVGNEMWGDFQMGYMPLKSYVRKHNLMAKAMLKVDPSIKLIAVGQVNVEPIEPEDPDMPPEGEPEGVPEGVPGGEERNRDWSDGMLRECADYMDLISDHFYCGPIKPVTEHVRQMVDGIRRRSEIHRDYRERLKSLKGKDIRIALDEWNYWYGPEIYGEAGIRRYHQDALGIATGLHEIYRNTDIILMANTHPVNVHGCIKTNQTDAAFEVHGLVMKMYRQHFGNLPVVVAGSAEPLSVSAAWTSDRRALTVGVVNPTEEKFELPINIIDAELTGKGRLWRIANSDPMAYNEPGKEPQVVIEEKQLSSISSELSVPPLSINLYEFPVR